MGFGFKLDHASVWLDYADLVLDYNLSFIGVKWLVDLADDFDFSLGCRIRLWFVFVESISSVLIFRLGLLSDSDCGWLIQIVFGQCLF